MKSVFGPGFHRDHKTEDTIRGNTYRQGLDEDGVIRLFNSRDVVYERNFDFKWFYFLTWYDLDESHGKDDKECYGAPQYANSKRSAKENLHFFITGYARIFRMDAGGGSRGGIVGRSIFHNLRLHINYVHASRAFQLIDKY